ncbi:MAG: hypothetical protein WBN38_11575, partial [Polyangiales bacterium]
GVEPEARPTEIALDPPEAKTTPERKSSTGATRPRRRRPREKRQASANPASEAQKPSKKTPAPPESQPDPVDIDIQNPYRN